MTVVTYFIGYFKITSKQEHMDNQLKCSLLSVVKEYLNPSLKALHDLKFCDAAVITSCIADFAGPAIPYEFQT